MGKLIYCVLELIFHPKMLLFHLKILLQVINCNNNQRVSKLQSKKRDCYHHFIQHFIFSLFPTVHIKRYILLIILIKRVEIVDVGFQTSLSWSTIRHFVINIYKERVSQRERERERTMII